MMSNDVATLFTEKADLERKMTELIAEFEERYSHKIEIDDIRLERMRIIGPHKALCKLTIKVSD